MHLQGFDDYGAAFALWGASDTGFDDHSGGMQVKGKLGQKTSRLTPAFLMSRTRSDQPLSYVIGFVLRSDPERYDP
jgi:hypothetical protein